MYTMTKVFRPGNVRSRSDRMRVGCEAIVVGYDSLSVLPWDTIGQMTACFFAGISKASRSGLVTAMHTEMNSAIRRSTSRISLAYPFSRERTDWHSIVLLESLWRVSGAREHAVKHATSTPLICYAWRDTKTAVLLWAILAILRDVTGRSARAELAQLQSRRNLERLRNSYSKKTGLHISFQFLHCTVWIEKCYNS